MVAKPAEPTIAIPSRHLLTLLTVSGLFAQIVVDVVSEYPLTPADRALVDAGLLAIDEDGRATGISAELAGAMDAAGDLLAPYLEADVEIHVAGGRLRDSEVASDSARDAPAASDV